MSATAEQPGRRRRSWAWKVAVAVPVLLAAVLYFLYVLPFWGVPFNGSRHGRVPLTPPWALECWLWEDDVNTGAFVEELLEGYARHDIPVRTILIDSPWSERYNDFNVDESRYPEPAQFFGNLQGRGYRVVLWMTCMVNNENKDTLVRASPGFFNHALTNRYLAGDGYQIKWWKGQGGFIDYSNPEAMQWWRGLQQQVLDWGVDGWKLDGADTLFSSSIGKLPVPFNRTHNGWMSTRTYMDHYAREEFRHGLSRNPEFVTLIRALNGRWAHPEGFAPLDAAPVTWVGDNQHTWGEKERGLQAAIRDILGSAKLGYCVIGSDVAGYHGRSNPEDIGAATASLIAKWPSRSTPGPVDPSASASEDNSIAPNIYIRWAQFSAFCGLFLNGGHGERRLWKRTPAELEIIRKFSWLHTELVPYMYSHVVACHAGGPPLMRPLRQGRFHYRFGDDFLVAPIYENGSRRTVMLPPGRWRYFFDDAEVLDGPVTINREFPLDEYPVFVREGAIVPLNVSRGYTGLGDTNSAGYRTWLVYPGVNSAFTTVHPETHPAQESTTLTLRAGERTELTFSGEKQPHILRIFATRQPVAITLDGEALPAGTRWHFDEAARKLVVRSNTYQTGHYVIHWR